MAKGPKYQPKDFESQWVKTWQQDKTYKTPDVSKGDKKMYILDMYPYPSGSGLHVGHVEGYTATDIYSRYMRMNGVKVLHPMGWDAFGLPAENYAVKTGVHPEITTNEAIEMFKKQIDATGLSYDWEREVGSHRPDYYKWTQWLFLLLYKKGLAYRKEALVNWDPVDQTVLANEQVLPDGTADRSGAKVEQKMLTQWFFKITDYAERLLQDLDKLDWPESTKAGQRNWIGKSEGAEVEFELKGAQLKEKTNVRIFTTRIDTIYGVTFMSISPENKMVTALADASTNKQEIMAYVEAAKGKNELSRQTEKDKTGVEIKGIKAINPFNGEEVPVFVADYVLVSYGTGAVMGVPAHDERDNAFATKYKLPIRKVLKPTESDSKEKETEELFTGYGIATEAGDATGKPSAEAKKILTKFAEEKGFGVGKINYRLRDWLISRQRFWGAPIPVVYDKDGKEHIVDEKDLPVFLPMDVEFKPTGVSPLKDHAEFQKVDEAKYGKGSYREADTMDTFVDSSWYFFRFTDPNNEKEFASKEQMNKWGAVDLYVGGAEHTVLHLLYARFFTKVLFDEGYITFDEPFLKLRHQGTILGPNHMKMSKSKGNVINPLEISELYGADTLRMYEMFMGPFSDMKAWNTENIQGVYRFLTRVWNMYNDESSFSSEGNKEVTSMLHKTIKKVSEDIQDMKFNTGISTMMEFLNTWDGKSMSNEEGRLFLKILAPYAPFITEEIWHTNLGEKTSIHKEEWPKFDESKIDTGNIEVPVQVNGKVRAVITVESADAAKEEIEKLALAQPKVVEHIGGKEYKLIYVPGRIVNFMVKG